MTDLIIPGESKGANVPLDPETGQEMFARTEESKLIIPPEVQRNIHIPPLYYWEDVVNGQSELMTMAFQWKGHNYGLSYPISQAEAENVVKKKMMRDKLYKAVKEVLDVLIHHGSQILDRSGNINPAAVLDQEAIRFSYDKNWKTKVVVFNKLAKIFPITKEKAKELKLL